MAFTLDRLPMVTAAIVLFVLSWKSLGAALQASSLSTRWRPQPPPCSLNGRRVDHGYNKCICDAPWTGPDCSILKFKPITFPQGYGMEPNVTSWGGNILFDNETKSHHLYVATMTHGCPLRNWVTNSRINHAVSQNSITGPYIFRDVAVNTWSHNPAPIRLADGSFAIVHIGDASGAANGGKSCSSRIIHGDDTEEQVQPERRVGSSPKTTRGSTIHISNSLHGPWTPLEPNTLGKCNNPSPFVHKNGTIFMVCNNHELLKSQQITGPWTLVTNLNHVGGPLGKYEDAFFYVDNRGSYHLLWHVYNTTENPPHGHNCTNSTVSAHSYSMDGYSWFTSPTQPYTTNILLSSGTTMTVATRERPKVFFRDGTMSHLINGVCGARNCPHGPSSGCVDCKYDSWDFTLIAPLSYE